MKTTKILLFLCFSIAINVQAQFCSDGDKDILQELWVDFNKPTFTNWDYDVGGNNELDDTWEGITMTPDGCHIQEINLPSAGLTGTISPFVGLLGELTVLQLAFNDIGGELPDELGDLGNLTFMNLGNNDFIGEIPESLEALSNIESLFLANNGFVGGLNADYSQLDNLLGLNLGGNNLSGTIPIAYGNFMSLNYINIQGNDLSGSIPNQFTNLFNLERMFIGGNDLTGIIPPTLGDLPLLRVFHCENNQLSGTMPGNILVSGSLPSLWLHGNEFSGCIPLSFDFYCPNQSILRIEDNPFLDNDDFSTYCSSDVGACLPDPADDFVTTWKTTNPGFSTDHQIFLPTVGVANDYDYDVDWDNDGTFDDFNLTGSITHTYASPGQYTVRIRGDFPQILFNNNFDKDKIVEVNQWGAQKWTTMWRSFYGCTNLSIPATDLPDLSEATSMTLMFAEIGFINIDISDWEVGNITTMNNMFENSNLSILNYDALLISWSQQSLSPNVTFSAGTSSYCAGASARQSILDNFNWIITDGAPCPVSMTLDIHAQLQGPYNLVNDEMTVSIKDHPTFPLTEPNTALGYNHIEGGGETTNAIVLNHVGDQSIIDWVIVEIRDANNLSTILESQSALLRRDGAIVRPENGLTWLNFNYVGFFYDKIVVTVRHRNHLGLQSVDPIIISSPGQTITVDFSDPNLAVEGGLNARAVLNAKRGLLSGDANHDGAINAIDKNNFWRVQNGDVYDYFISNSDFNLDGSVNSIDKNNHWRINNGKSHFLD